MSILKTILDCGKEIFLPRDREPVFRLFARKQELFQKNKTERKVFLRENYRGEKQLVIPDGYEEIGFNALEKCRRLEDKFGVAFFAGVSGSGNRKEPGRERLYGLLKSAFVSEGYGSQKRSDFRCNPVQRTKKASRFFDSLLCIRSGSRSRTVSETFVFYKG